jgi:hypothetical protein
MSALHKANEIGVFWQLDSKLIEVALKWANKVIEPWKDVESKDVQWEILSLEINDVEPKVREIVRELIKRSQLCWAQHAEDLEKELEPEEEFDEDEDKTSEKSCW